MRVGQPAARRRNGLVRAGRERCCRLLVVVVVLVVLASVFVEVWTDRLWFQSLGFGEVYTTVLWTRVGLFVVFGLAARGATVGNVYLAFRMRPILFGDGYRNPPIERYQDTLDPFRRWVLIGLGAILFLFGGASAAGQWKTYLLWQQPGRRSARRTSTSTRTSRSSSSTTRGCASCSASATRSCCSSLVAAIITHYLYGGFRLPRRARSSRAAQVQFSVLLGLLVLLKAFSYWLDRFGLTTSDSRLFTGISYTGDNAVLPSKEILAVIAVLCAGLFFANVVRRPGCCPVSGTVVLILSAILLGGCGRRVQQLRVRPSEPVQGGAVHHQEHRGDAPGVRPGDAEVINYAGDDDGDSRRELRRTPRCCPGSG